MSVQTTEPLLRRIAKASITNQIARYAPALYVRLTGQTGRGAEEGSVDDVGNYFHDCVDNYFALASVKHNEPSFCATNASWNTVPGTCPASRYL